MLEQILEPLGANLLWAQNGIQAIEFIKSNNHIDLVLMDIKMPLMDGIEATKQIKKYNPEIPVIAQTAFAMANEEKKLREQNFDDYIKKPLNTKDLFLKIESWLNRNRVN